jgi:hypothetical protein
MFYEIDTRPLVNISLQVWSSNGEGRVEQDRSYKTFFSSSLTEGQKS